MYGYKASLVIRDRSSAVLDHDIPVIAMTANAFPEDRARALACGMNDFLAKPVDRSLLASLVDKGLQPAHGTAARGAVRYSGHCLANDAPAAVAESRALRKLYRSTRPRALE